MAVEARYRMAQLHEAAGETEQAFALYEEAASTNNGDVAARARFRLGELYEGREEYDKAARSFMRVAILFLHQDLSPESLWRAARNYTAAGAPERAKKAYEEILRDYPDSEFAQKARAALDEAGGGTPQETPAGG